MLSEGQARYSAIPSDGCIFYFARDRSAFGFLSHFYPSPITLDGEEWPTVEHYYQAQKCDHPAYRGAIRSARSPGMAKRLAAPPGAPRRLSGQSWFRKAGISPRRDWDEVKLDIMRKADLAKFTQHVDLGSLLLGTFPAELVEDNAYEPFWGRAQDGAGQNWAGRVLMEIRDKLQSISSSTR